MNGMVGIVIIVFILGIIVWFVVGQLWDYSFGRASHKEELIKPRYYFKYQFPSREMEEKSVEENLTALEFYQKYGKYRVLKEWTEFEEECTCKFVSYYIKHPEYDKPTHLVVYRDICVDILSLSNIGCSENELLDYVKSHTDRLDFIEGMQPEELHVLRFDYEVSCRLKYETIS